MKVKFLINASGKFNLSYGPGDVAELDAKQAELLIEAGACEVVAEEVAEKVEKAEKAEKPKTIKKK